MSIGYGAPLPEIEWDGDARYVPPHKVAGASAYQWMLTTAAEAGVFGSAQGSVVSAAQHVYAKSTAELNQWSTKNEVAAVDTQARADALPELVASIWEWISSYMVENMARAALQALEQRRFEARFQMQQPAPTDEVPANPFQAALSKLKEQK